MGDASVETGPAANSVNVELAQSFWVGGGGGSMGARCGTVRKEAHVRTDGRTDGERTGGEGRLSSRIGVTGN